MTQITKCVETLVLFAAAALVVVLNRELFFETRHMGNLLGENETGKEQRLHEAG
jgi:hypothetical protein